MDAFTIKRLYVDEGCLDKNLSSITILSYYLIVNHYLQVGFVRINIKQPATT